MCASLRHADVSEVKTPPLGTGFSIASGVGEQKKKKGVGGATPPATSKVGPPPYLMILEHLFLRVLSHWQGVGQPEHGCGPPLPSQRRDNLQNHWLIGTCNSRGFPR